MPARARLMPPPLTEPALVPTVTRLLTGAVSTTRVSTFLVALPPLIEVYS